MSEKNWSIGFYEEFAVDFDFELKDTEDYGWKEWFDNVLDGLDEPDIRVLHSLDAVKERPDLLPSVSNKYGIADRNLYFAFEGSADDFMEQMLRNSSACGFSGTFITFDNTRQRFCHQHIYDGELDTGWVWLEKEWFPQDFDEICDAEEFLDYIDNYRDLTGEFGSADAAPDSTDKLNNINQENVEEVYESIKDKVHFFEKYGVNANNHYFSKKYTDDLPDSFTIENCTHNLNSKIKERFNYLLENGIEKFDEWIEKQGI